MLAVDLMVEQLQRQRNLVNARVKLEEEKKKLVELKFPQKGAEGAEGAEGAKATKGAKAAKSAKSAGEAEEPYMKPGLDKHGKTIERPGRPL